MVASLGLEEIPGPSVEEQKPKESRSGAPKERTRKHRDPKRPTLDDEEPEDQKGLGTWITEYLIDQLSKPKSYTIHMSARLLIVHLSDELGPQTWRSLPWKSLGAKLANAGIFLKNWPEGVPFPPVDARKKRKGKHAKVEVDDDDDDDDDDEPKRKVPKSLQGLSLINLRFIFNALRNEDHPLQFQRYEDGRPSGMFVNLC